MVGSRSPKLVQGFLVGGSRHNGHVGSHAASRQAQLQVFGVVGETSRQATGPLDAGLGQGVLLGHIVGNEKDTRILIQDRGPTRGVSLDDDERFTQRVELLHNDPPHTSPTANDEMVSQV